ncbi:hypothetical protein [Nonomuraea sp. NPDC050310]|uniref:hypothetical protein n=1 Tax=Nonomuraea sp. NPDC050310 TaxID=3154935 RepID=UPI0034116E22
MPRPIRLAPISVTLLLAGAGAGALVYGALAWIGFPASTGKATISEALEIVKIALAVIAGVGGVIALVVAYRSQRV